MTAPELLPAPAAAATMLLTWKYRLNPDKRQHRDLKAYALQDQQFYNAALEERMRAYAGLNAARYELVWRPWLNEEGTPKLAKDGTPAGSYDKAQRLNAGRQPHPRRDLLQALLAIGRKPSRAQQKKIDTAIAAGEAPPAANGPKVTADDVLNRRRWIIAAVLTEALTLAQRLDMLDRLEPVSQELREDLEAFHAPAETPMRLAEALVAPPDPRRAFTHARLVAEMQRRWEAAKHSLSNVDQSRSLTVIRADDPAFGERQRRVQRNTLDRLQKTYNAMYAGGGKPKFKAERYALSFGFDAWAQIDYTDRRFRFDGLAGGLRHMKDRALPSVPDDETTEEFIGNVRFAPAIKNVHFKAEDKCLGRVSRWYVGLQVEVMTAPTRTEGKSIGVDWGTSQLAALSSGEVIANPRFGEQGAKALTRAQRTVARRPDKSSRRRAKALRHKRAIERKTTNRRRNHFDKVSKRLATHYRTVCVEVIDAKGLMDAERPGETIPEFVKTRRNREVLDAAPYLLRQMTGYKTVRYAAERREVDPTAITEFDNNPLSPTQRCCMCRRLHFKERIDEPWHVCTTPGPFFSLKLPRKLNAARVIEMAAFGDFGTLSSADDDRGGPVPGGAAGVPAANSGDDRRRLGKTAGERSPTGRRPPVGLPAHTYGLYPRPPPSRLRTEPT